MHPEPDACPENSDEELIAGLRAEVAAEDAEGVQRTAQAGRKVWPADAEPEGAGDAAGPSPFSE